MYSPSESRLHQHQYDQTYGAQAVEQHVDPHADPEVPLPPHDIHRGYQCYESVEELPWQPDVVQREQRGVDQRRPAPEPRHGRKQVPRKYISSTHGTATFRARLRITIVRTTVWSYLCRFEIKPSSSNHAGHQP